MSINIVTITDNSSFVVLGERGVDIKQFLNINDIGEETRNKISCLFDIKDKNKLSLSEVLIDRWMLYQEGMDSIYVKHVASNRMNVLYQIILSGQDWDGVYEFMLKGRKILVKGYIINDQKVLVIESNGNYNLATFDVPSNPHTVCRMDFKSDEEFKRALLGTGLISEEELEIYYKPDPIIKPYLNRVLPRIMLK